MSKSASTSDNRKIGGTAGQVLTKVDGTNYNVSWVTPSNYAPLINTVAYASTLTPTIAYFDLVRVTLTGNITAFNLTGGTDGQKVIVEFMQDATGNRSIVFGSSIRFGTDIFTYTPSVAPNKTDRVGFIYNLAANKYDIVAIVKGF